MKFSTFKAILDSGSEKNQRILEVRDALTLSKIIKRYVEKSLGSLKGEIRYKICWMRFGYAIFSQSLARLCIKTEKQFNTIRLSTILRSQKSCT